MPKPPKKPEPFGVGPVRVRVQKGPKDGRWWWRAEVYEDGKSHTIWRGWATADEAARAVAAAFAKDGTDPNPAHGDRCEVVTDMMELWLGRQESRQKATDDGEGLSRHTITANRIAARKVKATIGDVRLERLNRATLERFRDTRLRDGAATSTVRQELIAAVSAWRYVREHGLVENRDLPRPALKVKPSPKRSRVTPSRGDVVDVLRFLSGWKRVAALLYAATGCRLGELHDLPWSRVDLATGIAAVRGKTGLREVPLAPPVVEALRAWRAEQLFPPRPEDRILGVTAHTVRTNLREAIGKACDAVNAEREKAGIEARVTRWSPNGFRRAAVGALYRSGVDIGAAAAVIGHSPTTAVRTYREVTEADRRDAVRMARLGYFVDTEVVSLEEERKKRG